MSTASAHAALLERMDVLRRAFLTQVPERLRQLDDALAGGGTEKEDWRTLAERHAHSLKGTAATFGFAELAAAAGGLEGALRELATKGAARGPVDEARATLQRVAAHVAAVPASRSRELPAAMLGDAWIVASANLAVGHELAQQAADWRRFDSATAALEAFSRELPSVVVVELGIAGADELIAQARSRAVPVFGLGAERSFATRLAAVRAGVTHFAAPPFDLPAFVEDVERLVQRTGDAPARVVIVDDERPAAVLYAAMLEAEGMLVRVVTDPRRTLDELDDFAPDVLLVDLYMPECNGAELATVLRQDPSYVGLPIMFLSAEKDVDKHVAALGHGADDFMVKPVAAANLVAQVRSRVARARAMRALMHHDSLTGLLNHIALKERIAAEVARARRDGAPLAVALIDLDKFKKVNDTYGHPAGDRVLRALARVLRQRLRRSDGVGRYGGEEFAVVLPGARPEDAARVLDDVRRTFGQVVHQVGARSFQVTLSAGVAVVTGADDVRDHEQLLSAADEALYEAKRSGRDRVVLSDIGMALSAE